MSIGQYCNRHIITTHKDMEIGEVARMMRQNHVGVVVIIERRDDDDAEYPIGIVTDRDLVMEVLALGLSPSAVTVGDIMSNNLIMAKEDDNFWRTLDWMSAQGVRRLPVVNKNGALVGIVTLDDILAVLGMGLSDITRLVQRQKAKEVLHRQ